MLVINRNSDSADGQEITKMVMKGVLYISL